MMKLTSGALLLALTQLAPQVAQASDWGCKVLVCLSDKRGPETEAECRPPIQDLWKELAKPHPHFPSCETSGNSRAEMGYSWYDQCPADTVALAQGTYAIQGTPEQLAAYKAASFFRRNAVFAQAVTYTGIGDGLNQAFQRIGFGRETLPAKTCVGNALGQVTRSVSDGYRNTAVVATLYDKVVTVPPARSPRMINILIDNSIWHTVRY